MKSMDFKLRQEDEFIKLGQLLKACNLAGNGGEAKVRILKGDVKVNGSIETARGKKIKAGDRVEIDDVCIDIIK